ncbi:MAG: hypothetical protein ACT4OT_13240 [Acidobacteriota bacterium]
MLAQLRVVAVSFLLMIAGTQVAGAQNQAQTPTEATDLRIPRDSKVYIVPADGFEQYIAAALRKKSVPLLIVVDRDAADFEITVTHEKKDAGWAITIVWEILQGSASASMQVVNLKTRVVVFADSSHRTVAYRGERSTAKKLIQMLKRRMEKDEKKFRQINSAKAVSPTQR